MCKYLGGFFASVLFVCFKKSKGGLVEALRIDQVNSQVNVVSPHTFNQRLTPVRQFLGWCMDVLTSQFDLPSNTESAQILRPFDKEIPPSGRV